VCIIPFGICLPKSLLLSRKHKPIHNPPSSSLKSITIAVKIRLSRLNFKICPNFTGSLSTAICFQSGFIPSGIEPESIEVVLRQPEIKRLMLNMNAILVNIELTTTSEEHFIIVFVLMGKKVLFGKIHTFTII
jgi:hypothetical protein